ncbi:hypothetical protein AVEN_130918-1 [Araneus ventricosus]|uniref:Uncharacterized protein n=1 Tax=Araneus ventricosus TaxID=182803 RepID=A0A4Y2SH97_ARAVE|nr:hypothetical protein AVEN_130918-1 [Araneus ventricosus]
MVGKRVLQGSIRRRDPDFSKDFHATSLPVRNTINTRQYDSTGNAFEESLWSFVCSASWKAGDINAIESAVTVIISELLSVRVAGSGRAVTVIASNLLSVCVDNLYEC